MSESVFGTTVFGTTVFGTTVFGTTVFGTTVFGTTVFGKTVFPAGTTVYAYDHLSLCVRRAEVRSVSIYNVQRGGTVETSVDYNLTPLDTERHGAIGERNSEPFHLSRITDQMVYQTLPQAMAYLDTRKAEMRRWYAESSDAPAVPSSEPS